jgi:DNA replication protein DnaC
MNEPRPSHSELREQAGALRLHGLQAHWAEVMGDPLQSRWVAQMLSWEATERGRRSLERRLRAAHIGRFKPLADFDWAWPKSIERGAVEELMTLDFLKEASNVVLVGPNGVGKTMCACNLGYQAVLAGHTALFTTAGNLLGELAALDSDSGSCASTPHPTCWSSTRWATCRIRTGTPTCCSSWSAGATSTRALS